MFQIFWAAQINQKRRPIRVPCCVPKNSSRLSIVRKCIYRHATDDARIEQGSGVRSSVAKLAPLTSQR